MNGTTVSNARGRGTEAEPLPSPPGSPAGRVGRYRWTIVALLIVPTMFAPMAGSMWTAVAIVSVAAAAHQWWSANLFTTVSDMFPRRAVASVIGIGGFAGAMAAMLAQRATGRLLQASKSDYTIIFVICGVTYVVALLLSTSWCRGWSRPASRPAVTPEPRAAARLDRLESYDRSMPPSLPRRLLSA